jgi:hypothetical protein
MEVDESAAKVNPKLMARAVFPIVILIIFPHGS